MNTVDKEGSTILATRQRADSARYGSVLNAPDTTAESCLIGEDNKAFVAEPAGAGPSDPSQPSTHAEVNASIKNDQAETTSLAPSVADSVAPLVADKGDSLGNSPASDDVKEEAWWRILLELIIPFILAGMGMVAAGQLLNIFQVHTSIVHLLQFCFSLLRPIFFFAIFSLKDWKGK